MQKNQEGRVLGGNNQKNQNDKSETRQRLQKAKQIWGRTRGNIFKNKTLYKKNANTGTERTSKIHTNIFTSKRKTNTAKMKK